MTCASCVRRVEKALGKVAGRARGEREPGHREGQRGLRPGGGRRGPAGAAVERPATSWARLRAARSGGRAAPAAGPLPTRRVGAGHTARRPSSGGRAAGEAPTRTSASGSARSTTCGASGWSASAAGLAMMALMYLPLDIADGRARADAADRGDRRPVLGGRAFYRAAWAAARHGGTNMNTLVAVGTSVAYGYSAFVTLWPRAGPALGLPAAPVLRDGGHHHRPDPARPLARGAREEADQRRDQGADGPPGADGARHSRRRRAGRPDRAGAGRRPGARAPRREGAGRRRGRSRAARRSTRAC